MTPFFGEIPSFGSLLMRRKCFLGQHSEVCECVLSRRAAVTDPLWIRRRRRPLLLEQTPHDESNSLKGLCVFPCPSEK